MDFGDYVRLIRRSAWIIIVLILLGTVAGSGLTLVQKPVYGATATGIVSARANTVEQLGQVGPITSQAVTNLSSVATSSFILARVVDDLHLRTTPKALGARVIAAAQPDSNVITITAQATTAAEAAEIPNAVLSELNGSLAQFLPGSDNAKVALRLFTTDPATPPASPVSPKPLRNIALGALAGLVLALVLAVLRNLLDGRIMTLHDLERVTERPALGFFLRDERSPRSAATASAFAASSGAEAVRTLRTNLRFLDSPAAVRSFAVTSPSPHEDRTELTATLAIAMSDLGRSVLVVDADLRRAKLAPYLGLDGEVGLTDVLLRHVRPSTAIQQWNDAPLFVLPAGSPTERPNELVQSDGMADLVTRLQLEYDVVIFNTPPLLVASDAAVVATYTSGALVVVEMGRTARPQLVAALTALDRVGAQTVGLVATGLREAARPTRYTRRARRVTPTGRELVAPEPWDATVEQSLR